MKKLHLLLLTCISSFNLFAQPTLTSSTVPKLGDVVTTAYVNSSGLSQGASGANQTWDFTHVAVTSYLTETYVDPATTSYSSDYPNANLASSDGSGNYEYYNITSGEYDNLGVAGGSSYFNYSDGEKILSFPFTYNDSYTDNFSGTNTGSSPITGSVKITADGYGTLKTPAGTFTNVLRISMKEAYTDSLTNSNDKIHYFYQSYLWYANGFNTPLFSLSIDTVYFDTDLDEPETYVYYSVTGPSAVNTITPNFNFTVFPNPTSNNVLINSAENIKRITVKNILGENVIDMTEENSNPGNPVEISLADLPAGIYFCNVSTPLGNVTRKIVKE